MSTTILLAVAAFVVAGCAGEVRQDPAAESSEKSGGPTPSAFEIPDGATRIGDEITARASVQLAAVKLDPASYLDQTVLIEAEAANVCQAAGCWMTLTAGEGDPIWVRWSTGCRGQYAFPKDSAGRRILVQGTLSETEISPEAAEHIAGESDGLEAEEIAGKTFEINATACVILPAESAGSEPS